MQVPDDQVKGRNPLWRLRSKDEASNFWEQEFGRRVPDDKSETTSEQLPAEAVKDIHKKKCFNLSNKAPKTNESREEVKNTNRVDESHVGTACQAHVYE